MFHVSILTVVINKTIIIINFYCTLACLQNYSGGLLWPTSRQNRVVTQSCSTLHPSFRSRVAVSRKCNNDGTWGPVDDTGCTVLNDAIPILLISFEVNVSKEESLHVVNNVSLNNYNIIRTFAHIVTVYECMVFIVFRLYSR